MQIELTRHEGSQDVSLRTSLPVLRALLRLAGDGPLTGYLPELEDVQTIAEVLGGSLYDMVGPLDPGQILVVDVPAILGADR
jgi:hypothetical protein